MGSANIRNGPGHRAYRRKRDALRHRVLASQGTDHEIVCAWCGQSFNLTLPDTDRMGFTADHPEELQHGGHLVRQELAPFHNVCNIHKSKHVTVEIWAAT